MKSWLRYNNTEMYLTHNKRKSAGVDRFIRTFKNEICKHMSAVSKNVYNNKLDEIVNNYNNTYPRTIITKTAIF